MCDDPCVTAGFYGSACIRNFTYGFCNTYSITSQQSALLFVSLLFTGRCVFILSGSFCGTLTFYLLLWQSTFPPAFLLGVPPCMVTFESRFPVRWYVFGLQLRISHSGHHSVSLPSLPPPPLIPPG